MTYILVIVSTEMPPDLVFFFKKKAILKQQNFFLRGLSYHTVGLLRNHYGLSYFAALPRPLYVVLNYFKSYLLVAGITYASITPSHLIYIFMITPRCHVRLQTIIIFVLFLSMEIHASQPTVTDGFCFTGVDTFIKKKNETDKNCERRE